MFYGREYELKTLNDLYSSDRYEMVVLYGRRQVGKTNLIAEFLKGKEGIYFVGQQASVQENLDRLSRQILDYFGEENQDLSFASYQEAMAYVFEKASEKRIVLALDEFPYMEQGYRGLSSVLQNLIDKYKDNSKVMIILCGSSISFMEDEVMAYKAPLYGRRTAQIKLEPFSFKQVCGYLNGFSNEDKALIYGAVGGTPLYLKEMDPRFTFYENIDRKFLDPSGLFNTEGDNFLRQEVKARTPT